MIRDILQTHLDPDEKMSHLTRYLYSLPNKGVGECVSFVLSTDDSNLVSYVTRYLAILPDLEVEKQTIAEHILYSNQSLMINMAIIVKYLPFEIIDQLVEKYLEDKSLQGMDSVIFEVARYFPDRLVEYVGILEDDSIIPFLFNDGPDVWVDDIREEYLEDEDPSSLVDLARFRTNYALAALLFLQAHVSAEYKETLYACIESSGMFVETQQYSVHKKIYQGFIVEREVSPHHMGLVNSGKFPLCRSCHKPGLHILTLDRSSLEFGLCASSNLSFFIFQCYCSVEDYVFMCFDEQTAHDAGIVLTNEQPNNSVIPGQPSLFLVPVINHFGTVFETVSGSANHQVGGHPAWIEFERFPKCVKCHHGMQFIASIDSGITPFGNMDFDGIIYCFWCDSCAISATRMQH